ncbi:hypothetical protein ABT381_12350 [Streptomyces sp. NPDC000151]|uniref:hypothetical protein n=1 Tax=Streptomyces sp. NPDC000151 TaxID=3154244 RepID=UPI00331A5103
MPAETLGAAHGGEVRRRRARRAMPRLLAAALTCLAAAALAVGAGLGAVAVLHATPEQPNVPLVTFERTGG